MATNFNINHAIPEDYIPYKSITFCSNTFISLKYFIDDNGLIPLLIGEGEFPRIWIYAKNENKPISIVKDNIAIIPQVKVNLFQIERKINVEMFDLKNNYIKLVEINISNDYPTVTELDLRPIGYNVYGNMQSLNIGESKYSVNTFNGMHSLVKIETNNNRQ